MGHTSGLGGCLKPQISGGKYFFICLVFQKPWQQSFASPSDRLAANAQVDTEDFWNSCVGSFFRNFRQCKFFKNADGTQEFEVFGRNSMRCRIIGDKSWSFRSHQRKSRFSKTSRRNLGFWNTLPQCALKVLAQNIDTVFCLWFQ